MNTKPFLWLVNLFATVSIVWADPALPSSVSSYPILITLQGGTGSGFCLVNSNYAALVTAKHVLFDIQDPRLPLRGEHATAKCRAANETNPELFELKLDLTNLLIMGNIRAHAQHDVAAIRIGDISLISPETFRILFGPGIQKASASTNDAPYVMTRDFVKTADQVDLYNDVYIFGFPNVGIPERKRIDYESPLARRGIVSGRNKAQQILIIDTPVEFGNSGGPVLMVVEEGPFKKHMYVIGIVTEYVPTIEAQGNRVAMLSNSGYSVIEPMEHVLELLR